jgi:hypothetical protein
MRFWAGIAVICFAGCSLQAQAGPLDPKGKIHIPIGIPNTLDTLKTFVEAEGNFSPGFGSYGIYFWIYDKTTKTLTAPTMEGMPCAHGLAKGGLLIPWARWNAGDIHVETEVCEVVRPSPAGDCFVAAARVYLTNTGRDMHDVSLIAALRPLGPAGFAVNDLKMDLPRRAMLVNGHPALLLSRVSGAGVGGGVISYDTVAAVAQRGEVPREMAAHSDTGDCSGAFGIYLNLIPGKPVSVGFACPVLPGRRAVGHRWDGKSSWAQLDLNDLNPKTGGVLQPDPGVEYFRALDADAFFEQAAKYWTDFTARVSIRTPDIRWANCFNAISEHVGIAMNDDAPDVSVINYNVFNRDGVYVTNVFQKTAHFELAERAIDYFLAHPFNGRSYPEADNPGQVLWIMGEHLKFARDKQWLARVYPSARKLARMIRYYRTTPGDHWVTPTSLEFGDALPKDKRQKLDPGRCDGHHPEYTEAFDIAGLRGAAALAEAAGRADDAKLWNQLADELFAQYDRAFGSKLLEQYGSYCVLWPCHLYPLDRGKAHDQFASVGPQLPRSWRYFPLATAHQGLLAGNREAGFATINRHLDEEQARGWYAFDEGGKSAPGNWPKVRTTWDPSVAMPHGWAIAEMHLLIRDALVFEDDDKLVLLAGVPPEWLTDGPGISFNNLPTHFGPCSFTYTPGKGLTLTGKANPPGGFVLRLPEGDVRLRQ